MHRAIRIAVVVLLVATIPIVALSCRDSEVSVRTGLVVECKYNHVIKDTTRYVKVAAERAKDYKVSEEVTVCAAHARAQQLYAQAQKALAAGNKAKARALFGTLADLDPNFKDVASKYKSLGGKPPTSGTIAGKTGNESGGTGSTGGNGSGKEPGKGGQPEAGYLARIPASLSPLPYKQVSKNEDALSGSRLFAARRSSYKVRLLTVNVTWIGKKTKFTDWYRRMLGAKFSMDKDRRVSVPGSTGLFGTDGGKLCNLCWARGGLVYQVELEAKSTAPRTLKTEAKTVAQKL